MHPVAEQEPNTRRLTADRLQMPKRTVLLPVLQDIGPPHLDAAGLLQLRNHAVQPTGDQCVQGETTHNRRLRNRPPEYELLVVPRVHGELEFIVEVLGAVVFTAYALVAVDHGDADTGVTMLRGETLRVLDCAEEVVGCGDPWRPDEDGVEVLVQRNVVGGLVV